MVAWEELDQLRQERNNLIAETDWMALGDNTLSEAWKTYRQELRDMPSTAPTPSFDNNGRLIDVTWPTKPE